MASDSGLPQHRDQIVLKIKPAGNAVLKDLAGHKFDTSQYVVMKSGVARDASTGRLVERKLAASKDKLRAK